MTLKNQVPTLFIHGYAGNRFSSGSMIKRFERYGWGQKSTVIVIKADGTLKITGDPNVPGGFIQVLFDNNRMSVMHQTDWLWRLMSTLKNEYSIERVNTVLERCSAQEAKVIADVVKATKLSIDKYL